MVPYWEAREEGCPSTFTGRSSTVTDDQRDIYPSAESDARLDALRSWAARPTVSRVQYVPWILYLLLLGGGAYYYCTVLCREEGLLYCIGVTKKNYCTKPTIDTAKLETYEVKTSVYGRNRPRNLSHKFESSRNVSQAILTE